ncbi:MAG: nucleotidyltransferase family protein [Magnetococcus sp. YQC-5]
MSKPQREEILEILRRHKEMLAMRYGVTVLGLFGSVARDDACDTSDVDILYDTIDPNLYRTVRMKLELEALLGCPVDVLRWHDGLHPRLKQRIERDACYV